MEDVLKICHIKNLKKVDFNSTLNISVDANANVKTILDINSYLFNIKADCTDGKAIISGKIGVSVLYLDTDNIFNTITDTQNFSETILDPSITKDNFLTLNNSTISASHTSTENIIKLSFNISMAPILYLNLPIKNNIKNTESLITKTSEVLTNCISNKINTSFEYVSNIETKDNISKILAQNKYFNPTKTTAENGFITVEGKLINSVLYETIVDNETVLKEVHKTTNIKYDLELNSITKEEHLDLSFSIDKSLDEISTVQDENEYVITAKNLICVQGVSLKQIEIQMIDDVFSTNNDIEPALATREFNKIGNCFSVCEIISNEVGLLDSEPAIDEVVANLNMNPEITNCYIKNNKITFEGVVTSNLTYIDENKELKNKLVEIPFVIDSKTESELLGCAHHEISVVDYRVKIKRGTIIEIEYTLFIRMCQYEVSSCTMVDSFTIGKQLDFSKYDFQIYIAKAGETMWDLCKRIKISPNEITNLNKDLPLVMEGGEKIIIKR